MSAASAKNLQQAATIAAAVAATLGQPAVAGAPVTAATAINILASAVEAAGPLISPEVGAAVSLATLALSAFHIALQGGSGMTHEQMLAVFEQDTADDNAAIAEDVAARAALAAKAASAAAAIAPAKKV